MGEWPWSRDVIADALIRMRELGSERAVFDIEYLSKSPKGVPSDADFTIERVIDRQKDEIAEIVGQLALSVQRGFISPSEVGAQSEQMLHSYILPSLDAAKNEITAGSMQDNDVYFAKALQFFGNAWLTVNTRNISIPKQEGDEEYAAARLLLNNVSDKNNFIVRDNNFTSVNQYGGEQSDFTLALRALVERAQGVGFTNVVIDSDGTRRRVELLFERNGKYAAQLAFSPLLNLLDVEAIIRKKHSLTLQGALFPGKTERENVTIPLDEHGRMMINWAHTDFGKSFRHESLLFLRQLDWMESDIFRSLENIKAQSLRAKDGRELAYVTDAAQLFSEYESILAEKERLLSLCTGIGADGTVRDGIAPEEYRAYFDRRGAYFNAVNAYAAADYMQSAAAAVEELGIQNDERVRQFLESLREEFSFLSDNISTYLLYMSEMKQAYGGSFCILGNTASSTTDQGATPFTRLYPNVGTHANVLNTLLQKAFITPVSWAYGFAAALILVALHFAVTRSMTARVQNISGAVLPVVIFAFPVALMVTADIYIPSVGTTLFVVLNYAAGIMLRYISGEREKRYIRQIASTYVSKDVVKQLEENPELFTLGGRNRHITALFSDIKSFSSFSELVTADRLITILNQYLGALSDVIIDHQGTIDKYIGDSIVSFFGAPLDLSDHAYKACAAAIRMKQAEAEFNRVHMIANDIPQKVFTRIGINTGDMVVGNMGTQTGKISKMNYTMLGDNVNLASRLEGVNKVYGSWILCSEETFKDVESGAYKGEILFKKLDKVRVVGKSRPVQLYNILGFKKELPPNLAEETEMFHEALAKYLNRDFAAAQKLFLKANALIPDDQAALVFADRCKTYAQKAVPDEWDGIMNLTAK
ncbi:MAG: CHASE2 domain-containing protein [Treponema sp.]